MVSQLEAKKLCISTLVATASAFGALLVSRWLEKRRGPKYVSPTIPDYVDIDWDDIEGEERQVLATKVLMASPGLLFGSRDPWLIANQSKLEVTKQDACMSASF